MDRPLRYPPRGNDHGASMRTRGGRLYSVYEVTVQGEHTHESAPPLPSRRSATTLAGERVFCRFGAARKNFTKQNMQQRRD